MAAVVWDSPPSLRERLQVLRRHRRIVLLVLAGGALVTAALAVLWPPTYRATATILIEQQEIPQDFVRTAISSFADQRVQVISQRVMTSQNLMRIVERYDLYPWQRRTQARESVIERMRDDIKMRLISANVVDPRSGRPMQATIAFTVGYQNRSADLALKVANELTSLYLSENLTIRTAAAQQSAGFLSDEAAHLRDEMQAQAAKIAAFKEKHKDALPELSQVNFQLLDRTELDLRDARNRLGSLDEQKVLLQAQLLQMSPTSQMFNETGQRILSPADRLKTLKSELAALKARYGPTHPDVVKDEREVAGLQTEVSADGSANDLLRRLDEARTQLAAARERYSAEHPDVLRLQHVVDAIEQQVNQLPAVERVRQARTNPDNPAYIQLDAQLHAVLAERSATERKAAELQQRIDDFQLRLARAPAVEREYRGLMRDYETAQLKYQEVRSKEHEAHSAQDLETERKGERFTMIEPPLPPESPVSPNRPVLLLLGLIASAAIAFVVMIVRDGFDTSVRGARDLTRLVEVPPLAAIPLIETRADRAKQVRTVRVWWQAGVASLVVAVVLVHVFVRPLDILWLSLLRRLGL